MSDPKPPNDKVLDCLSPNAITAAADDSPFLTASLSESSGLTDTDHERSDNNVTSIDDCRTDVNPFVVTAAPENYTAQNNSHAGAAPTPANDTLPFELSEAQTLERRTQSVPALADHIASDDTTCSETTTCGADADGEEVKKVVVTETLYHLHSKPRVSPLPSPRASRSNSRNTSYGAAKSLLDRRPRGNEPAPLSLSNTSTHQVQRLGDKGVIDYAAYLMGMDYAAEVDTDCDTVEDAWSVATKRRGVYNLIQVPLKLERLLWFVVFICTDEFLSMFTFLPLRATFAAFKMQYWMLAKPFDMLNNRLRRQGAANVPPLRSRATEARRTKARVGHVIDILHLSILLFTASFLTLFDISWVYHNIRGQSVIKLYVVFNVMEIFDRLCSSFGVDMLDALGWTTASAVSFLSRPSMRNNSSAGRAHFLQAVWLLSRVAFDYIFALAYASLHAGLLLVWVVTLNVAINTTNHALLTLLIANNFVELKGAVFKNYKVQNVFQIACSDGVERFQLSVFLGIMLAYTTSRPALLRTWLTIFACEVLVDWIKHAFSTKFNRIPHRVYSHFSFVIAHDIAQTRTHAAVRSVGGSAVAKRIGFVSLPLAALTLRMAASTVYRIPSPALVLLFVTLCWTKLALSIALTGHAQRRLARETVAEETNGDEVSDVAKWTESLAHLARYDLISKT